MPGTPSQTTPSAQMGDLALKMAHADLVSLKRIGIALIVLFFTTIAAVAIAGFMLKAVLSEIEQDIKSATDSIRTTMDLAQDSVDPDRVASVMRGLQNVLDMMDSSWSRFSLAAILGLGSDFMEIMNALDLDAMGRLMDRAVIDKLIYLLDTGYSTFRALEIQRGEQGIGNVTSSLLEIMAHLKNVSATIDRLSDKLEHGGLQVGLMSSSSTRSP